MKRKQKATSDARLEASRASKGARGIYYIGAYLLPCGRYCAGIARGNGFVMLGRPTIKAEAERSAVAFTKDIRARLSPFFLHGDPERGLPYGVRPPHDPNQSLPPSKIPYIC
jgi:hypothetical protein